MTRLKLGTIYLLESHGLYKIGKAKDFKKRLSGLQTGNPNLRVVMLHSIPENHLDFVEKHLHTRFAKRRIFREWFSLSTADILEFLRMFRPHYQIRYRYKQLL